MNIDGLSQEATMLRRLTADAAELIALGTFISLVATLAQVLAA